MTSATTCKLVPSCRHSKGFDLQSIISNQSTTVSICLTPSLLSFPHGFLLVGAQFLSDRHRVLSHLVYTLFQLLTTEVVGFHLEIRPSLEVLILICTVSYTLRFHPLHAMTTLLTFCSSGFLALDALDCSFLFQSLVLS
jgi:hypothetical protein